MKIKLWTIQDESGWNELQSKGILIANEKFVDPDFKTAYDWMKAKMKERIAYTPKASQYPVWAWYQYVNEHKKRPDLRESGFLPAGTTGYRIEIEKDQKDVLLSDFELWHTPLAYKVLIADSENELREFELKGDWGSAPFVDLPDEVRSKIEKSWEKIFDMDFDVKYFARPFREKQIQATFWELKRDEIVKVDQFKAR